MEKKNPLSLTNQTKLTKVRMAFGFIHILKSVQALEYGNSLETAVPWGYVDLGVEVR